VQPLRTSTARSEVSEHHDRAVRGLREPPSEVEIRSRGGPRPEGAAEVAAEGAVRQWGAPGSMRRPTRAQLWPPPPPPGGADSQIAPSDPSR
jgi:hypothetical protein